MFAAGLQRQGQDHGDAAAQTALGHDRDGARGELPPPAGARPPSAPAEWSDGRDRDAARAVPVLIQRRGRKIVSSTQGWTNVCSGLILVR